MFDMNLFGGQKMMVNTKWSKLETCGVLMLN